jgi:uncharacterized membrane protein YbhN (UPF0104 family)
MRRAAWALVKIAVSGGLILLLVRRIGLGPIVEAVRQVDPAWLMVGVLVVLVSNLLGSQQWRILLELAGVRLPRASVVAYYLVGIFFNNFLPSSVGGDVSRIVDAGRASGRRAAVIGATLVDRLLGMTVISILAAVAAARLGDRLAEQPMARWVWLGVGLIFLASAGSLGLVMSRRLSGLVERWCARWPETARRPAGRLLAAIAPLREARRTALSLLALSLVVQVLRISTHVAVAAALDIRLEVGYFFLFVPLLAALVMVPICAGHGADLDQRHRCSREHGGGAVRAGGHGAGRRLGDAVPGLPGGGGRQPRRRDHLPRAPPGRASDRDLSGTPMTVAANVPREVQGPDGGLGERLVPWVGAVLCALVLAVYLTTMGRTVPFWDAGEFIATSKILGIPHPPGTPLYVMLGRIACLVPAGSIAERVNGLSAVAATLAVLFTFLATIKLVRAMWRGEEEAPAWLPLVAGLVAGLTLAFSETFWINAIEAEVYALSSMVMAISIWSVLAWRELPDREQQVGWLLVIFYILSLSIGVHLGTYLVLPGLAVLVTLEWMGQGPYRRPFAWTLVAIMVVLPLLAMLVATNPGAAGLEPLVRLLIRWVPVLGALAATGLILVRRPRLAVMLLALFLLGVSVHLYLLIRAGVDPPPSTRRRRSTRPTRPTGRRSGTS